MTTKSIAHVPVTEQALADTTLLNSSAYLKGIEGIVVGGESLLVDINISTVLSATLAGDKLANLEEGYSLDGLIAAAIAGKDSMRGKSTRRLKLDQWKYNSRGANQSYETLHSDALRSETSVRKQMQATCIL